MEVFVIVRYEPSSSYGEYAHKVFLNKEDADEYVRIENEDFSVYTNYVRKAKVN